MSRGYLLFAIDTENVNYTQLALACALTIKITQPDGYNSVALVTNSPNDNPVFDHVINYTGPTGMDARSRAYDYTPFDETVLLDADMLFLKDMSHYWNYMHKDLFVCTSPQNHKGHSFSYGYYRRLFEDNKLFDVYNAWTYFRKTQQVKDFFDTVKLLTDHPEQFISQCLPMSNLTTIPTDEAFALALGMLDIDAVESRWDFPRITHMKPMVQGWNEYTVDWQDKLRFQLDQQGQVKLGPWAQTELLHYVNKELITDDIIKTLERVYAK